MLVDQTQIQVEEKEDLTVTEEDEPRLQSCPQNYVHKTISRLITDRGDKILIGVSGSLPHEQSSMPPAQPALDLPILLPELLCWRIIMTPHTAISRVWYYSGNKYARHCQLHVHCNGMCLFCCPAMSKPPTEPANHLFF